MSENAVEVPVTKRPAPNEELDVTAIKARCIVLFSKFAREVQMSPSAYADGIEIIDGAVDRYIEDQRA